MYYILVNNIKEEENAEKNIEIQVMDQAKTKRHSVLASKNYLQRSWVV